jgi:hypothetical protein
MRALATAIFAFFIAINAATAAQLAGQKSDHAGVTITVTPRNVVAGAKAWDFGVAMNTHSQELSDDLAKSAALVDEKGREYRPIGWEGAKPGGHHRSGVLKFAPIDPLPRSLELRIQRPGEKTPRVFQWPL